MSGIIIDGVAYTPAMLRTIILERHQMADDLRRARLELVWTFPGRQEDGSLRAAIAAHQKGLRGLVEERKRLVEELALIRDTLRLRTEALNRLVEEHGPVLN